MLTAIMHPAVAIVKEKSNKSRLQVAAVMQVAVEGQAWEGVALSIRYNVFEILEITSNNYKSE